MKQMELVGKCQDELSLYCIDAYTVGHVIFGHLCFLIVFFFGLFFPNYVIGKIISEQALFVSIVVGLVWELIENNIITRTGFKKVRDSLNNSLFDIVFVGIGSVIGLLTMCTLSNIYEMMILISIIVLSIEIGMFYITVHYTYNKNV